MGNKKRNALKHGANATEVMLWSERYEDYEALRAVRGIYPLRQYRGISGPNALGFALAQAAPRVPCADRNPTAAGYPPRPPGVPLVSPTGADHLDPELISAIALDLAR